MASLENNKIQTTFQQTSTVIASTNTVTMTISNTDGPNSGNSFKQGCSRILGIRLSSDAAGLVPLLIGSTIFPTATCLPRITTITESGAAGSAATVAVVFRAQASTVGNGYVTLVWVNEVATNLYNA